jgi:predicted amidophosphoribosyltransferase
MIIQGMKPSSAVLARPSNSGPEKCCFCSRDYQPTNYEERTMRMCQECSKSVDDDYLENSEDYIKRKGDDELNVSYFIFISQLFKLIFISLDFHGVLRSGKFN